MADLLNNSDSFSSIEDDTSEDDTSEDSLIFEEEDVDCLGEDVEAVDGEYGIEPYLFEPVPKGEGEDPAADSDASDEEDTLIDDYADFGSWIVFLSIIKLPKECLNEFLRNYSRSATVSCHHADNLAWNDGRSTKMLSNQLTDVNKQRDSEHFQ